MSYYIDRNIIRVERNRLKEHRLKAQKHIRELTFQVRMYDKYFGMLKNMSNAEYREVKYFNYF